MRPALRRPLAAFALAAWFLALAVPAWSDAPVPEHILNPRSAAEAWNIIRLATKNVDRLLEENRPAEIPLQISYCSPALRALTLLTANPDDLTPVQTLVTRAFVSVNAIATAGKQNNPVGAKSALASLRGVLEKVAQHFDAKTVGADIFLCPEHADFLSENPQAPCPKCERQLLARRIPYSNIYMTPGVPTVRVTATADGPIVAGKKVGIQVRLAKANGAPLLPRDLLIVDSQPMQLLVAEPGLGDYHHALPLPTKTPGEYAFSFTPARTAPYRIWADLVPAATGMQELPYVDLPSTGKAGPVEDTANRFTAAAGGFQFVLAFRDGNHLPTKAGQARPMSITTTGPDGQPVTSLEPVLNSFCHLVGFYDDYQTVLHLHATGGEVLDPARRGGPSLGFILFPPKAGFLRLYCQVSIGGRMFVAPFSLNVEP